MQRPMLEDGGLAQEEAEVDWSRGVAPEELLKMKTVVQELKAKR